MKGWLVTACLVALAGAAARPASAQSELALFDKDVDYAARIDPALLADGAAFTRSLGGDLAMLANLVTLGSVGILAFDVLEARAWQNLGIDGSKGVWLSYAVATERNQLHHVRLVAHLAPGSRSAFDNWLLRLLRLDARWTGKGRGLDQVIGTSDKQALAAIGRHKPVLVGRRGKVKLMVRARGDQRIFDITWPYGVQDWDWSDQGKALLAALDLPEKSASLATHQSVSLEAATSAPIGLWLRSGSLAKLDAASIIAPVQCKRLDQALRIGPLSELAVVIDPTQQPGARLVWRIGDPTGIARALEVASESIPSDNSALFAELKLAGAAGLRALNRPVLFHELGWPGTWRLARQCGNGHRLDLLVFHWLDLAGQWLDDVAATSQTAQTIVESVGPLAVRLNMFGTRAVPHPVLDVKALVAPAGADELARLFDSVFPHRRIREEAVTVWSKGRIKPYRKDRLVGAVIGNIAAADIQTSLSSRPFFTAKAPFTASINVPDLLAIVATMVPPGLAASVRAAGNRWHLGMVQLSFDDQALRLELGL